MKEIEIHFDQWSKMYLSLDTQPEIQILNWLLSILFSLGVSF